MGVVKSRRGPFFGFFFTLLLVDALLRQRAETENVRKMGMERAEDAKKFALQTLIKDLIVVFDTMELALANVKG